jgi:hypothetical protein
MSHLLLSLKVKSKANPSSNQAIIQIGQPMESIIKRNSHLEQTPHFRESFYSIYPTKPSRLIRDTAPAATRRGFAASDDMAAVKLPVAEAEAFNDKEVDTLTGRVRSGAVVVWWGRLLVSDAREVISTTAVSTLGATSVTFVASVVAVMMLVTLPLGTVMPLFLAQVSEVMVCGTTFVSARWVEGGEERAGTLTPLQQYFLTRQ